MLFVGQPRGAALRGRIREPEDLTVELALGQPGVDPADVLPAGDPEANRLGGLPAGRPEDRPAAVGDGFEQSSNAPAPDVVQRAVLARSDPLVVRDCRVRGEGRLDCAGLCARNPEADTAGDDGLYSDSRPGHRSNAPRQATPSPDSRSWAIVVMNPSVGRRKDHSAS